MTAAAAGFGASLALALIIPSHLDRKHKETSKEWYRQHIQDNVWIAPPALVFPIVWTIVYIFLATAVGIWSIKPEPEASGGNYIATWVLIAFNIVFAKLWTLLTFSFRDKKWSLPAALADAFFLFGTAVAIVVLFHVSSETSVAVFVLWYLYLVWTLFIFIFAFAWWLCSRKGGLGIDYTPVNYDVRMDL